MNFNQRNKKEIIRHIKGWIEAKDDDTLRKLGMYALCAANFINPIAIDRPKEKSLKEKEARFMGIARYGDVAVGDRFYKVDCEFRGFDFTYTKTDMENIAMAHNGRLEQFFPDDQVILE